MSPEKHMKALYWYVKLRRAYRHHGVLPYPRRKTWDEARFTVRMRALSLSGGGREGPGR